MARSFSAKAYSGAVFGSMGAHWYMGVTLHSIPATIANGVASYPCFDRYPYPEDESSPFTISSTHWVGQDGSTEYSISSLDSQPGDSNVLGSHLQAGLTGSISYHSWMWTCHSLNRNPTFTSDQLDFSVESPEDIIEAYARITSGGVSLAKEVYTGTIVQEQMGIWDCRVLNTASDWWHPVLTTPSDVRRTALALIGLKHDGTGTDQRVMAVCDSAPEGTVEWPAIELVKAYLADVQGPHWADAYMMCPFGYDGLSLQPYAGADIRAYLENLSRITMSASITGWAMTSYGHMPIGTVTAYTSTFSPITCGGGFLRSSAASVEVPAWG